MKPLNVRNIAGNIISELHKLQITFVILFVMSVSETILVANNRPGNNTIKTEKKGTNKSVGPFSLNIHTVNEGNITLKEGTYCMSMYIYKQANCSIEHFQTYINNSLNSIDWQIDTIDEGNWSVMKQNISIPNDMDNARLYFSVNILTNGADTGIFYIDNVSFEAVQVINNADENRSSDFQVYPNPASDFFTVHSDNACHYQLYSSTGSIMYRSDVAMNKFRISVKNLDSGLYLLHLMSGEEKIVRKIIIN